jgi:pyrroloquinoline quinone biosynthesis protein D
MTREAIPADGHPKIAARARLQTDKVSGKPMLVYPEGVLMLNPTGLAIATLCTGRATVDEIVAELAARYKIPPSEIAVEVNGYMERLRARNLLLILSEPEPKHTA